jgi:hypothetical protein
VEDPHVLLGRPLRSLLAEGVVGHAEAAAGEQVGLVAVVGERPRLAHQPVDDVPVVDPVLAPPPQPGQRFRLPLGVPDLDPLGVQPGLHPLADEPTRHRVGVALHADGAARLHPHPQPLARLQPLGGERPQHGQLLGQPGLPPGVALAEQLPQEEPVGIAAGEVPTAPQQQGLLQGPLELVVTLLTVAVLMGLAGVDRLPLQPVMRQQRLVAPLEHLRVGPRLHRRRQPVGTVDLGHATQFPQGVLQALAEALQALRKTDGPRLPIRVGEHEVIEQVREGVARQGDPQLGAVGEIAGRQPAGVMHLGEEDLLGRPPLGPPPLDPPLQGPQLAVAEAARVLAPQGLKERLGFQARVEGQLPLDPGPDPVEGVLARPPGVLHAYLARQPSQPPVLACGLLIQAGLRRRPAFGQLAAIQAEQAADLLVGDPHPEPPFSWGSG